MREISNPPALLYPGIVLGYFFTLPSEKKLLNECLSGLFVLVAPVMSNSFLGNLLGVDAKRSKPHNAQ